MAQKYHPDAAISREESTEEEKAGGVQEVDAAEPATASQETGIVSVEDMFIAVKAAFDKLVELND